MNIILGKVVTVVGRDLDAVGMQFLHLRSFEENQGEVDD